MQGRSLKICVLCNISSIHCRRWVEGLKSRRHNVFVLSEQKKSTDAIQMKILNRPPHIIKMFPNMRKLVNMIYRKINAKRVRKILLHERPDIVFAHFLIDNAWRAIAANYHPIVAIAYGSDILVSPNRNLIDRIIVKRCLQKADGVIGVAHHMKRKLLAFGCSEEKVKIIHNAVDIELFNIDGRKFKNHLKPLSRPIIISARPMESIYNLELLIMELPSIIKECPSAKIIIVGCGREEHRIRSLTRKLRVYESIKFLPTIPYERMPSLFKKADIFISTSRSDGLCVTLLESMACGTFPIVSDIAGNRELIDDGTNGYLFPLNVPGRLAEAVIKTIKNPKIIPSAISKNLNLIKENYTKSLQLKETENFFYHIIDKRKL